MKLYISDNFHQDGYTVVANSEQDAKDIICATLKHEVHKRDVQSETFREYEIARGLIVINEFNCSE